MLFPKSRLIKELPFLDHPLFYGLLFLPANVLLSCPALPPSEKLWIGIFGLGLPLILGFSALGKKSEANQPLPLLGASLYIPPVTWLILAFSAIAARFYRLGDLSSWPTRDDGNYSFAALELNRYGSLPFFYGIGELPPVFPHLLAAFMRCFEPSLSSLWLFPALISLLTVPVGYWAVRSFASQTFSFIYALLLAVGFWPVMLGRFCVGWVMVIFWEYLVLGTLAGFLKTPSSSRSFHRPLALGVVVAAGFYVSWVLGIFVAVAVAFVVVTDSFFRGEKNWKGGSLFFMAAGVILLPWAFEAFTQGIGRHVQEVVLGGKGFDWPGQLILCGRYFAGLFWTGDSPGYNYGPVEGGFLNPLLSTSFFVGLLWLARFRHRFEVRWACWTAVFFLLPGFLTYDLEMQRLALVLPFLLFVALLGIFSMASGHERRWATIFLALLLGISAGWDFYRLAVPFREALNLSWHSQTLKSEESFNAYRILRVKATEDGPGRLFLDYVPVPLDQTLFLATYPFNATENPKWEFSKPKWMAFLANVNYGPFLEKRFAGGEWHVLGSNLLPWDGELMLGIVPLTPLNQGTAETWEKAQPVFHGSTAGILRQSEGKSREGMLEDFFKGYPLVQGDPFLKSAFWEIAYFNHSADKRFQDSFGDLTRILREGYPAAHIFNELGTLLWFKKDYSGAQRAFQKAVRIGGNHTLAVENLRQLESGNGN